tara:strand:+ start:197 stop:475 length:279 start_codon:yes stop_codon:yes gene_type:complete
MKNKGNIMKRDVDFVVENPQFSLKDGEFMFDTWTGLVWPVTDEGKLDVMSEAVHITDVTDEFMESLDNWDKRHLEAWVMRMHDFGGLDKSNL